MNQTGFVDDWEEINEWDSEEEVDQRLTIATVHTTTVLDDDFDAQANGDDTFEYIETRNKPTYSHVVARSRRAARQARKQEAAAAKVADGSTNQSVSAPADDGDATVYSEPEREQARPRRTRRSTQSDPEDHPTASNDADLEGDEFSTRDTRKVRGVHGRITNKERDVKRFVQMYDPDSVPYSRGDNNRDPTFCFVKACKKSDRVKSEHAMWKGKRKGAKKFSNDKLSLV